MKRFLEGKYEIVNEVASDYVVIGMDAEKFPFAEKAGYLPLAKSTGTNTYDDSEIKVIRISSIMAAIEILNTLNYAQITCNKWSLKGLLRKYDARIIHGWKNNFRVEKNELHQKMLNAIKDVLTELGGKVNFEKEMPGELPWTSIPMDGMLLSYDVKVEKMRVDGENVLFYPTDERLDCEEDDRWYSLYEETTKCDLDEIYNALVIIYDKR